MAEPTPDNPATEASPVDQGASEAGVAGAADEIEPTSPGGTGLADEAAKSEVDGPGVEMNSEQPSTEPDIDLSHLPAHTRSLLKIEVAVTVTLARQRRPIHEITELGPGTLVKFDKTYDEPLELTVGDLPIARGEVVKVGDKFGLRIGKLIRPHERFASVARGE
jgi:flagellar motor switch protein FliN/FliY